MHRIHASVVDVFGTDPLAGAPAGVVHPQPEITLTDEQRQAVASELVPEATVVVEEVGDRAVHVDIVGPDRPAHDRLPLASLVAVHGGEPAAGTYTVETATHRHELEVEDDGIAWQAIDDRTPAVEAVDTAAVAEAVGLDLSAFDPVDLSPAVASAGRSWLTLAVPYVSELKRLAPPDGLSDRWDVTGLYAMTFETIESASTVHARAFVDGAEVPAVPSGAAAAGAYLQWADAIETPTVRIEQGDLLGRAGRIDVRAEHTVRVGGRGVLGIEGTVSVPESDTGIIEA